MFKLVLPPPPQISQAIDNEKRGLNESKNEALVKLKQELNKEREGEEDKFRLESCTTLDQLKEKLRSEMEKDREAIEEAHKVKMEALRLESEEELLKRRQTIESRRKEDIEALEREKEKEYEDVSDSINVCSCIDLLAMLDDSYHI